MWLVAACTGLGIGVDGDIMLIDEWPVHVGMALGARGFFITLQHIVIGPAVHIVAVDAVHLPFEHRMVGILMKLVLDVLVAVEAELILRLRQHQHVVDRLVNFMAITTAHLG